jgi:hypothetical protein
MAEQRTHKPQVTGSNPVVATHHRKVVFLFIPPERIEKSTADSGFVRISGSSFEGLIKGWAVRPDRSRLGFA